MKKLILCFSIFLFQLNHSCSTARMRRQCHLRYTDEQFRKDIGNRYLKEALEEARKPRVLNKLQTSANNQPKRGRSAQPRPQGFRPFKPDADLSSLLIIQSMLPDLYYPPKIRPFEFLPKN
jgi:hypothetical protein